MKRALRQAKAETRLSLIHDCIWVKMPAELEARGERMFRRIMAEAAVADRHKLILGPAR
jgi:hypothetical protein